MTWRQLRVPWAQVTGPVFSLTGQAQVIGAIPWCGPAMWPNSAVLEQFQIPHRFLNNVPFSQNEIARFFQRSVISKITYLIN